MIARYTHPEMGAIWSEQRRYETWLEVELAADRRDGRSRHRPGRGGARASRQGGVRHRPDRGDRADHPARRHRVHDRGRRAGRARRALAPLRADLVRRRRHRAGDPDARGLRPDRQGHRRADGGGARARRGAPAHADDRPHPRRARRADDVRPEAGAVVRRAAARSRPRAARARRRRRSARSRARSGRSRTSTRRSRRASARGSGCSRRRSRRRSSSAIATPS